MKRFLARIGLRRYVKVKVYLRSGQTVVFKCKEWEAKGHPPISNQNGLQQYSFQGIKGKTIWFNITEIVCLESEA